MLYRFLFSTSCFADETFVTGIITLLIDIAIDFEPRFLSHSSISHLAIENNALKVPNLDETRGSTKVYPISPFSSWNSTLAWTDIAAVERIYSQPGQEYGDLKRIVMSNGDRGSRVSLQLNITADKSSVWLCQLNLGVKYPPEFGLINTDADIFIKHVTNLKQLDDISKGLETKCAYSCHTTYSVIFFT